MKKIKIFFNIILLLFFTSIIEGKNLEFLKNEFKNYNFKYLIYINKKEKKLYLVNKKLSIVKKYKIATGKIKGNKLYKGDKRTPEGIYKITQIWQYKKPEKLKKLEKYLKKNKKEKNYKKIYKKYLKIKKYYEEGKKSLKRMNDVYFKKEDGFTKYGTDEDLGKNVYGTVFMRLSFPEKEDIKRYKEALKKGLIPKDKNGKFLKMGHGIAIHGTNDKNSIGHNASSGCIRLLNKDIEELSKFVDIGMKVIIE